MSYFGRTLHPEYTDLAAVIGPDVRWTECDYDDLQRHKPEVLLGYQVRLFTVSDVVQGKLRGRRAMRIIVLDGCHTVRGGKLVEREVWNYLQTYPWAKVEHWHVHRGRGIWRIA